MTMDLYNQGFLCKCCNWLTEENEFSEQIETVLHHEESCEGKEKIKELLGFQD